MTVTVCESTVTPSLTGLNHFRSSHNKGGNKMTITQSVLLNHLSYDADKAREAYLKAKAIYHPLSVDDGAKQNKES